MKRVMVMFIVLTLILTAVPAFAEDQGSAPMMIADVLIARPVSFVYMVVTSAVYVVALPFAALSGSVEPVTQTLVVKPFKITFTRPVGDFSSMEP